MEPDQHHENPQSSDENRSPYTPNSTSGTASGNQGSLGPVVGIIIVVILIVLAGFYFWGSNLEQKADPVSPDGLEMLNNDAAGGTLPTGSPEADTYDDTAGADIGAPLSDSDEVSNIETELNNTNLDGLDAELEEIDAELTL